MITQWYDNGWFCHGCFSPSSCSSLATSSSSPRSLLNTCTTNNALPISTGRPRKKLVSELLNSIKEALLCWMFKFSNALSCWMIGRWWLWRFSMTNFVLPKNGQKRPKCENVKFWIPSQWHFDCVQNFWGRPKSKIGRPVPFWKFQILGCWWWRELLSCVG